MKEFKNYLLCVGDNREKLKDLEDNSIDSIVTDPPYELGFMNKGWDASGIAYNVEMWKECYRVLKPGGFLLSFGGTRTYHRVACAIEDAGFELKDCIMYVFGSGFPKSHDLSKALDKELKMERTEVIGYSRGVTVASEDNQYGGINRGSVGIKQTGIDLPITAPASEIAKKYSGFGTALKPAYEPIILAKKPINAKNIASNLIKYGTGGINIDGCRVECDSKGSFPTGYHSTDTTVGKIRNEFRMEDRNPNGRWPANFIHDGSEEVIELFPNTKSSKPSEKNKDGGDYPENHTMELGFKKLQRTGFDDKGSVARFFYCAKASKQDRNEGCEDLEEKQYSSDGRETPNETAYQRNNSVSSNNHPTVKPTELMRYLVKLVTPPDGIVLDPFMGSGSTGKAAMLEGFKFIGIELNKEYVEISKRRIEYGLQNRKTTGTIRISGTTNREEPEID